MDFSWLMFAEARIITPSQRDECFYTLQRDNAVRKTQIMPAFSRTLDIWLTTIDFP